MPNLKASKKDLRKTKKRTAINKSVVSEVRTVYKKAKAAKEEEKKAAVSKAYSVIDKAVQRGIMKKNTASRYKSRLV